MPTDKARVRELLDRARRGEGQAWQQLLEASRNYLGLLARVQIDRRLQGKVTPSDIVQETFVAAFRSFGRFSGTTVEEWLAWLRRILAHRLAHAARRFLLARGRDVRLEQEWDQEMDESSHRMVAIASPQSTPSKQAMRLEEARLLADVLSRLPVHYQEVIIARHLEQLSFPEVAARMGQSEAAVKKTWARALAALRRAWREDCNDSTRTGSQHAAFPK